MLGSGASIRFLEVNDTKPAGCVAQAVNANAACYLLVKGRVDIDAEIEKAKTKLGKASKGVNKQRKIINRLEKAGKMKGEVAKIENKRLKDARRETEILEKSVSQFERLKLK